MSTPDRTGVLLGYRGWVLASYPKPHGSRLRGFMWPTLWSRHEATQATCGRNSTRSTALRGPCEEPPSFDCTCGLHAYYDPEKGLKIPPGAYAATRLWSVAGAALFWGRVIHHENRSFFRAQKSLPIALYSPPEDSPKRLPSVVSQALAGVAKELGARVFDDREELVNFAQKEASRW